MDGNTSDAGFAGVSRLRGRVFAGLAKGASWLGVVVLAWLLFMVFVDAFGLGAASQDWYFGALVGFGVPLMAYGGSLSRYRPDLQWTAVRATVIPPAGLVFAGFLFVLFLVFDPFFWFLYYTVGVLPAVAVYGHYASRDDTRAPLAAAAVAIVGFAAGYAVEPLIPIMPLPWIMLTWVLVVPAGALIAYRQAPGERRRQATILGATVAGAIIASFVGPTVLGVTSDTAVILYAAFGLPVAWYNGAVLARNPRDWPGLLAPLVALAAIGAGIRLGDVIGSHGPEPVLDWQFLQSAPSTIPADAGLFPAIVGSVFIIAIVAIVSFVVGVGAAIYLEEYAPQIGLGGTITRVIRVNIANLAGVPSVVYGLLGLGLFVNLLGMGLGIVLVAGLTLSLLILPIVIISAQEAIRSVPREVQQASYGMGATKWQTIREVVLPRAIPGILTGTILALSRAIGETAPLLMIGAATTVFRPPTGFASQVSAMPLQVFYWSFHQKSAFRELIAPAGVLTLLVVMLSMNVLAIYLRNRYESQA
ncbi:MAG: phosphate ABC transporter permease PstA [Halodesulfurarchaeum sp.]|nr:phosphate ABC transporter permease PstA [Halodesulfurarchaeum sp.]